MRTRKRHQTGSVQQRIRQGKLRWVGLYRDASGRRCITELDAKTRSQALSRMAEFLIPINAETNAGIKDRDITVAAYVEHVFIPFKERNWKLSTRQTNTARLKQHIIEGELGQERLAALDRDRMQAFLDARESCSKSVVDHLRFDLSDIMKLAESDGLIERSQTKVLFTPRCCAPKKSHAVMSVQQVKDALSVLDLRSRAFCRLAIIAGMRPGEIIALKWSDIKDDHALVDDRIYRGIADTTKNSDARTVYLAPSVRRDLELWRQFALTSSEYVFASERGTPIWYQNLWMRDIRPKLEKLGLKWADYRVMRRTNATLMHAAGADPKAAAAQRGHNIGVSIDEYTQSSLAEKSAAVNKLESLLIQ